MSPLPTPDGPWSDAERRLAELSTVQRVAQAITSAARLDQICQAVVDQLRRTFGYMLVSIYLREGDALHLQAQYGYTNVMALIRIDQGVSGRVVRTGQPAMVRDGASDPDFIAVMPGINQGIIVPLRYGDGPVLGTISIESDGNPPLADDDLALLSLLADQISVAVINARLLARSESSANRFSALLEAAGSVVYCMDPSLRITEWNHEAERAFGAARAAVLGVPFFEQLVAADERLPLLAIARRLLDGEVVRPFEWPIRRPGGEARYFIWTVVCQRTPDGAPSEILVVGQDITSRKLAEESRLALERKMQEAQRLESLGVLTGGIAHDFNNMLAAILGNAALLQLDLPPGSELYQSAREIALVCQRAADLVAQMLAYAGRGSFTVRPFNLNELVAEMLMLLRTSISKGAVLVQRLAPGLGLINGDAAQVRQVVMNLIVNASEALGEEGGTVTITTGLHTVDAAQAAACTLTPGLTPGRYVGLVVEDTGVGMDEAIIARMFDPFYTTKFTGRGLGLAAVLGIVRAHRGGLFVASTPGQGSRFTVLFPVLDAAVPLSPRPFAAQLAAQPPSATIQPCVLIVDDEDEVRRAMARLLERSGYTALVAADGLAGLAIASDLQQPIAAALIDLTMPGLSGEQLFHELRQLRPGLPVVIASGYANEEISRRFGADGPAGFLQKPFSVAELLETIRRVAERSP